MERAFTPIRLLSAETVNRIAAGEVIERPAAAVKELVENALDAGARRISVTIAGGGIDRIEVEDDGHGIPETDLPLAIERHATSKLADEALIRIATLGFRGEALPSIGAAGRLTLISRPRGQDAAAKITVEGGAVGPVGPAPGGFGTRAIVEDLFYATPARRKFLRSARSEAGACADLVRHLALAAPKVGFRLEIDGHVSFDLPPETAEARVGRLLGAQDSANLIAIEAERDSAMLSGFIGPATLTRAAARHQFFMVNGRPVRDPLLRTAIRVAYREVIPAGRHPVAFLWLDLPVDRLDVNVHPAKAELRFADPSGIRSLVIGALGRALAAPASLDAAPGFAAAAPGRVNVGGIPAAGRQSAQPLSWTRPSAPRRGFAETEARFGFDLAESLSTRPGLDDALAPHDPPDPRADMPTLGVPIAQIFDTYILARAEDGALILVDQHAAHERLTEERLRDERERGGIARQALLSPVPVDLPEDDVARLLDETEALGRLGLEIESFGPGAVLVRALPAAIGRADPGELLRDIADTLAETGTATALEARLDAVLARMACHRSIRAGRRLAGPEMIALLRDMAATPRAQTCPHGRPTVIRLGRDDIELLFGRR